MAVFKLNLTLRLYNKVLVSLSSGSVIQEIVYCHSNYVLSVINQACRNASADMIGDASACLLVLLKVYVRT